jgi:cytoskeletal protein RodZ
MYHNPAPKKSSNLVLKIVLGIVGAVLLLFCLVGGCTAVLIANSEDPTPTPIESSVTVDPTTETPTERPTTDEPTSSQPDERGFIRAMRTAGITEQEFSDADVLKVGYSACTVLSANGGNVEQSVQSIVTQLREAGRDANVNGLRIIVSQAKVYLCPGA